MTPNGRKAARPFTARSLVGMSEGAKKRLRERIFCGDQLPPFALGADSVTKGLRIGERLRPCPGCRACCLHPNGLNNLISWCDGSGVIERNALAPKIPVFLPQPDRTPGVHKSETPGVTRAFPRRCELADPQEEAEG